jgi:hypothetical protein
MSTSEEKLSQLKPYSEVRMIFSEGRRLQLETQGPVTQSVIRKIQRSRKYAHSPSLAGSRG